VRVAVTAINGDFSSRMMMEGVKALKGGYLTVPSMAPLMKLEVL
jgi:hypothetical protein